MSTIDTQLKRAAARSFNTARRRRTEAPQPPINRPQQDIIPEPGSIRYNLAPTYWSGVIATTCFVCGQPLGGGTWGIRWEPDRWAHLHCWDEKCETERAVGDNAWLSEESAKRHGLTIESFRELPSYERIKMNQRSQELRELANHNLVAATT